MGIRHVTFLVSVDTLVAWKVRLKVFDRPVMFSFTLIALAMVVEV